MSKYELVASDSKSANSNRLRLRTLDEQEFKTIKKAITDVLQFRSTLSLHEICKRNYRELIDLIDKITNDYGSGQILRETVQYDALLEVNRKVMNYLSSVRSFVEHYRKRYDEAAKLGKQDFKQFEDKQREFRNLNFAYLFLWEFRNYVQHHGLAAIGLRIIQQIDFAPEVFVLLDRDNLLQTYNRWGSLKSVLENQPQSINLTPLLNELQKCVDELNRLSLHDELALVEKSQKLLEVLRNEVYARAPGAIPTLTEVGNRQLAQWWLPEDAMQFVQTVRHTTTP